MKGHILWSFAIVFLHLIGGAAAESSGQTVFVAYPKTGSVIDSECIFIIGAAQPGSAVTCNSAPVKTNAAGFFAHGVNLERGDNTFSLVSPGSTATVLSLRRPSPPLALSPGALCIEPGTLEPAENRGLVAGDLLRLSANVTPGAQVHVELGNHLIALRGVGNLYTGTYRITAGDSFTSVKPKFIATRGTELVALEASGAISVVKQPVVYRTRHDDTIVRVGPGTARTTPWVEGVRALSDGYIGTFRRLEVAPGRHLWILNEDLDAEPLGTPPPESSISTISICSDDYGACVTVPVSQKLPYEIEQDLEARTLVLRVFGATANIDCVSFAVDEGSMVPEERASAKLIEYVTWEQKSEGCLELTVHLKEKHQWGFFADYQNAKLALHVKSRPAVIADGSLTGITVCIDAGHGGSETGALGCNGIKESVVNLSIAEKMKYELERLGARVVMTRTSDVEVSLAQRVAIAVSAKSDFLISVHNNAVPHRTNPWNHHGTSSHWYHPQSIELAKVLQDSLTADSGSTDLGSRYQNLFLCRPSQMLAVLIEVGYMTHPDEFRQLITPEFQAQAAESLARGLRLYLIHAAKK